MFLPEKNFEQGGKQNPILVLSITLKPNDKAISELKKNVSSRKKLWTRWQTKSYSGALDHLET